MRKDVEAENTGIITNWSAGFVSQLQAAETGYGIKHDRTKAPVKHKAKLRRGNNGISGIGITITKGIIFTNKGKGKGQEKGNRKEKPAWNETVGKTLPDLANALAEKTGDTVAGNLMID